MILCMTRAFASACLADVGAQRADIVCEVAAARHVRCRQSANRGAVHVQSNAFGHHLDVVFLQTRGGAVIARIRAGLARFDTRDKLLMHDVLLEG
jgi:hypothetical protein